MTHTVLVLVVFLLGGEPEAYVATLAPNVECNAAQAVAFAHQAEAQLGEAIQEEILWQCLPVQSPGRTRAPHEPQPHAPSDNEASLIEK